MGERGKDWCILRTSGPRTLAVARSLCAAGFDAWTPTQVVSRRKGRKRERVETDAPIIPTFVFARVAALPDLLRITTAPVSEYPPFSIFRYRDTFPAIADASLSALRDEEARLHHQRRKQERHVIPIGSNITMREGPFTGLTGIVEAGSGKEATVNFGSGFVVTIATYLLQLEVIHSGNKPS